MTDGLQNIGLPSAADDVFAHKKTRQSIRKSNFTSVLKIRMNRRQCVSSGGLRGVVSSKVFRLLTHKIELVASNPYQKGELRHPQNDKRKA